ncbi:MAG: hypothetical protein KGI50_04000 [Patescibacteria group bacterium]|nr:hypothetical protein [Patescibacteria group bacterium]MDE2438850.1 hypothetical protein [Patescibacteria group bacterium]
MSDTNDVQLYDLRRKTYPNQRGDSFRSLQVFLCPICAALTNKVVMGGYPGYGVRAVCPNSVEDWHHNLEDRVGLLHKFPHPKSYKEELQKEIDEMREAYKSLIKNDIVGNPDMNLMSAVTNTRSFHA